jgi:hypothetical protein
MLLVGITLHSNAAVDKYDWTKALVHEKLISFKYWSGTTAASVHAGK